MVAEEGGLQIVNLLLVLTLAWIFGNLAERFGYPALIGEITAGIVFGPAILGFLESTEPLRILAELGIFLLMVYVGMEIDLQDLFDLGPLSIVVALGGFIIPFGMGYFLGDILGMTIGQSLFIGIAMAATSLATKSRILVDLDLLDTRIAGILMGGALLSDVAILVVFAGMTGFIETGTVSASGVLLIVFEAVAFFAVALLFGDRVLPYLWDGMNSLMEKYGFINKTSAFTLALMVSLVFAWMASLAGLHMIIGGFVAGLFLRQAQLNDEIYDHMHTVIYDLAIGFFAPLFFVLVGFELTLGIFTTDLGLLVLFTVVAFFSKIVGTWLFVTPTKITSSESLVIGLGMNGRGTVEIIIVTIALNAGVIEQSLFSILVFIAIFTTALVPVTMKLGVDWLDRKGELFYLEKEKEEVQVETLQSD